MWASNEVNLFATLAYLEDIIKNHKILRRNKIKHAQAPCNINEKKHHAEQVYREQMLLWHNYDVKFLHASKLCEYKLRVSPNSFKPLFKKFIRFWSKRSKANNDFLKDLLSFKIFLAGS